MSDPTQAREALRAIAEVLDQSGGDRYAIEARSIARAALAALPDDGREDEPEWEVPAVAAFLHSEAIGCEYVTVDADGHTYGLGAQVKSVCRADHTTDAMSIVAHYQPALPDDGREGLDVERLARAMGSTGNCGHSSCPRDTSRHDDEASEVAREYAALVSADKP